MYHFRGLRFLETGYWVKVKGRAGSDGLFTALEITVKAPRDLSEIEGVIQQIDYVDRLATVGNLPIYMPNGVPVRDVPQDVVLINDLVGGDKVWIEGRYGNGRFQPTRIELKPVLDFNIEIYQGNIEWFDPDTKQFRVNGITTQILTNTSIESELEQLGHD